MATAQNTQLLFQEKVTENQAEFIAKVITICNELGINPNWLMSVMNFETAGTFSPSVKNPHSTAVGLIQFLESTAEGLGTTTAALAGMTNVEQLDYVYKYYVQQIKAHGHINNVADAYLAVFYPAAISWPLDKAFPENVAAVNSIFDGNHDGVITKQEIINKITSTIPQQYSLEIQQKKTSPIGAPLSQASC